MPELESTLTSDEKPSNRNEGLVSDVDYKDTLKQEDGPNEAYRFELSGLSESEYLSVSQAFASEYMGLLNGQNESEFQKQAQEKASSEITPLVEKTEHLDDQELAKYMVEGYRRSLNMLYGNRGKKVPFKDEIVSDDELGHVLRIGKGPYGIPIIFTDGFNEELFGDDTLSFAATELMLENGLPPAVIVFDGYNATEKEQVTTHETSHAVFTLLRRAGIIPSPEGEGVTEAGRKSAFELARDEAIAQLIANQNGTGHPSVIQRMKSENYTENSLEEYRTATNAFDRSVAEKAGLSFSDAILGVMMAKTFEEFNSHMLRMAKIAASQERLVGITSALPSYSKDKSGWGTV